MIRNYRESDKEELINILRLNTPRYFSPSEEQDFVEYLDHKLQLYFVVVENNVIIGSGGVNFVENGRVAKISWDLIHPYYQGKGIGSLLTKHRIKEIDKYMDVKKVIVRTSQLAYKFYEKAGLILVNRYKDFWAKGYDMYEMELMQ